MRVPWRPAHPNAKKQVTALLGVAYGNTIGTNAFGTPILRALNSPMLISMVLEVLFHVQVSKIQTDLSLMEKPLFFFFSVLSDNFSSFYLIIGQRATYQLETGVHYGGLSIGNCGSYNTRDELEAACTADSNCVGYSTYTQNIGGTPENGFYPWCLKITEDSKTVDATHNYYRKVVDSDGTGIFKFRMQI